jgi:DNA-binding PadR family transcriptional regulator
VNTWTRRRIQAELMIIGALTEGEHSGFMLAQRTGLNPGRVYVALARLEGTGRIKSDWEQGTYPRRRFYRLAEDRPDPS